MVLGLPSSRRASAGLPPDAALFQFRREPPPRFMRRSDRRRLGCSAGRTAADFVHAPIPTFRCTCRFLPVPLRRDASRASHVEFYASGKSPGASSFEFSFILVLTDSRLEWYAAGTPWRGFRHSVVPPPSPSLASSNRQAHPSAGTCFVANIRAVQQLQAVGPSGDDP